MFGTGSSVGNWRYPRRAHYIAPNRHFPFYSDRTRRSLISEQFLLHLYCCFKPAHWGILVERSLPFTMKMRIPGHKSSESSNLPEYRQWRSKSVRNLPPRGIDKRLLTDNVADHWWRDPGLRKCMLNIILLFGAIFANGYDGVAMTSLQANPRWLL